MSLLSHSLQFMFLGLLLLMGCNPENKEQAKAEISSFSPIEGPRAGGVELTISGKNLQFTNQVTVGGNICTDLVVASSSTLKCMLPARAAGTANIVIRNLANSFTTASSPFTYLQGANVTSVSPVFGPTTGGTTVTITGTNLTAGSVVRIGGTLCSAPIFQADELQITCTTSARAPELNLSLTILDLNGDTTTYPLAFSYVSGPTIASVTPSSGRVEGFPTNPTITIAGFAFSPGATVTIDGNSCPTTSVATSSIVCQPPAGSPGGKVVRVTNPDALFGTRANGYTYIDAPTLTGILPINGPLGGGRTVTLTGTNFLTGMTIDLGGSACTSPIVLSTTSMTCVTGLRAIQGAVLGTVTNSFGQTGNLTGAYNYRSPPDFTSVTPAQIGMSGGVISIVGADLFDVGATDPTVLVNGQTCTGVVFDGINTITCTAPALSPAPTTPLAVSIQIFNPDGQTDTQASALTYQPFPSIASITPSSGPLNAPQVVVITGTGFTATTTIDFLTAPVPGCTSYDYSLIPTQITCTIPAQGLGALTTVNVSSSIASPAQSTTRTNGYSFRPAPGLTAITAPEGNPAGGYNRTINGTNFFNGASLQARIDGVACNTTDYVSPTQITCSGVPASILPLPAVTPVTVINGDGQASTGTVNFTYRLRPSISSVVQNQGPSTTNLSATPPIQRESLIINGVRFDDPGVTVTVGGLACVVNDGLSTATQIYCDVPDAPVMALLPLTTPIIVTNTDGQVSTESFNYTYVGVATVTGVSPL
ncbi:MAG: IPT/TIG domain-containing protein, partial [Proteobacteria bacterium]|nr:IPT/TIG domain-containing protein [Pseudomonadota bacterium]